MKIDILHWYDLGIATTCSATTLSTACSTLTRSAGSATEASTRAIQALCAGVATELQWSIVAGATALAKAIERQGVVRGLQEHLDSAEAVLQAVYRRCRLPALWLRPTLTFEEIEAVQLLRELHAFQIEQLGRGEFLRAVDAATRLIVSEGNQVTLMRDIEEVAA